MATFSKSVKVVSTKFLPVQSAANSGVKPVAAISVNDYSYVIATVAKRQL